MNAVLKSALVRFARGLPMVVVAALMSATVPAHAAVTAFFSAGATCGGPASASYRAGATTQVSLCVTTTTESTCGYSIQVQAASVAETGLFRITNRTLGSGYPDPNYFGPVPYPININNPAVTADFGETVNGAPVPPTANQLLATFDITPASAAVSSTYVISTGSTFSAMSVDSPAQPGCGNAIDVLIPATFTLNYVSTPAFTSATSNTFTLNSAGSFAVTTSGTPAPTLSIVGALPSGVTFTPATGLLSGSPALGSVGSYPITITAANGNLPNATQSFTLVVQQASQSITFGALANRSISSGSFTLSATGGASGNAVTFSSSTTSICTVSGNTVTLMAIGTCTISANQAGDANYSAAPQVTQNINITQASPTIAVTGHGTSNLGANVTFTATLTGSVSATGTMNFRSGGTTISGCGTQTVASNVATCTTNGLPVGSASITAVYSGDTNNAPATSPAVTQTVNPPPQTLTVTVTGTGQGSVTGPGVNCPGVCSASVAQNTMVTLTVTPATGSIFTGWSGGGCTGTGLCTVTMSSAQSVAAQFTRQLGSLNVTLSGLPASGSVALAITGPDSYSTSNIVTTGTTLNLSNLPTGTYTVNAPSKTISGVYYQANARTQSVVVNVGVTATITVTYGVGVPPLIPIIDFLLQ